MFSPRKMARKLTAAEVEQSNDHRELESSGSSGESLSELSALETDTEFLIKQSSGLKNTAATKK